MLLYNQQAKAGQHQFSLLIFDFGAYFRTSDMAFSISATEACLKLFRAAPAYNFFKKVKNIKDRAFVSDQPQNPALQILIFYQ